MTESKKWGIGCTYLIEINWSQVPRSLDESDFAGDENDTMGWGERKQAT